MSIQEIEICIPEMGEAVREATITAIPVSEGSSVSEGDILVELSTDKINNEIVSDYSGIVKKVFHKENDVVSVGKAIILLGVGQKEEKVENTKETPPQKEENTISFSSISKIKEKILRLKNTLEEKGESDRKKPFSPLEKEVRETKPITAILEQKQESRDLSSKKEKTTNNNGVFSPLVRSIARKENITKEEFTKILGTGKDKRVTKSDILDFIREKRSSQTQNSTPTIKKEEKIIKETIQKSVQNTEIISVSPVRKTIADNMALSKQSIPHAYSIEEVFMDSVLEFRKKHKQYFLETYERNLTITPIVMYLMLLALKKSPLLYATYHNKRIYKSQSINIGFALAKDNGDLLVPVIKGSEKMNFRQFNEKFYELIEKVSKNKITVDELMDANFVISNIGKYKGTMGIPIINPGSAATLAIGTIAKKVVVIEDAEEDKIGIRSSSWFVLSHDHRIIDGVYAGSFFNTLKEIFAHADEYIDV